MTMTTGGIVEMTILVTQNIDAKMSTSGVVLNTKMTMINQALENMETLVTVKDDNVRLELRASTRPIAAATWTDACSSDADYE